MRSKLCLRKIFLNYWESFRFADVAWICKLNPTCKFSGWCRSWVFDDTIWHGKTVDMVSWTTPINILLLLTPLFFYAINIGVQRLSMPNLHSNGTQPVGICKNRNTNDEGKHQCIREICVNAKQSLNYWERIRIEDDVSWISLTPSMKFDQNIADFGIE